MSALPFKDAKKQLDKDLEHKHHRNGQHLNTLGRIVYCRPLFLPLDFVILHSESELLFHFLTEDELSTDVLEMYQCNVFEMFTSETIEFAH